jgi:hypothetical protein
VCKFAKHQYLGGPASAPRDVKMSKADKNTIHLVWKQPLSDGGTPITAYVIQYR